MSAPIPLVDLAAEWADVGPAVEKAVLETLRSGRYILGPETQAFEQALAEQVGTRFAVGVGSGTEAIALALRALGVGPGDEVVTTAFTYFATVEAILLIGARPVFVDLEEQGFHLDPDALEAAIGERTRALVPVHLFGRCADMARVCALAEARGIPVVEDAAQALGASRAGRCAGAWGVAGAFSFYPSKNLGAVGDAGAVTTDDPELAERLRRLGSHGRVGDRHELLGGTSRLDAVQAAALRAKLPFLEGWNRARARNAALYASELSGCAGLRLPDAGLDEVVTWHQYTLRCREPDALAAALAAEGIEARRYYPRPACAEAALGDERPPAGRFPRAERACSEVLSLPVRPSLAPDEIRRVADVVRGWLARD